MALHLLDVPKVPVVCLILLCMISVCRSQGLPELRELPESSWRGIGPSMELPPDYWPSEMSMESSPDYWPSEHCEEDEDGMKTQPINYTITITMGKGVLGSQNGLYIGLTGSWEHDGMNKMEPMHWEHKNSYGKDVDLLGPLNDWTDWTLGNDVDLLGPLNDWTDWRYRGTPRPVMTKVQLPRDFMYQFLSLMSLVPTELMSQMLNLEISEEEFMSQVPREFVSQLERLESQLPSELVSQLERLETSEDQNEVMMIESELTSQVMSQMSSLDMAQFPFARDIMSKVESQGMDAFPLLGSQGGFYRSKRASDNAHTREVKVGPMTYCGKSLMPREVFVMKEGTDGLYIHNIMIEVEAHDGMTHKYVFKGYNWLDDSWPHCNMASLIMNRERMSYSPTCHERGMDDTVDPRKLKKMSKMLQMLGVMHMPPLDLPA